MNNTPTLVNPSEPEQVITLPEIPQQLSQSPAPETPVASYSIFVPFHYKGKENGVKKEGMDSRVLLVPETANLGNVDEIKALSNAIATNLFDGGMRYKDLTVTLLNIVRLPV